MPPKKPVLALRAFDKQHQSAASGAEGKERVGVGQAWREAEQSVQGHRSTRKRHQQELSGNKRITSPKE